MAELTMQFLDVGQGDGIFTVFPNGVTMLVDLGSTKNKKVVTPAILAYFKTYTKFKDVGQTLDYLILTHPDRDHYNIILEFLKTLEIKVAKLFYGGEAGDYTFKPKQGEPSKAKNRIERIKELCPAVEILFINNFPSRLSGIAFNSAETNFGGADVYVLIANAPHPSANDEGWRKNTASVVLLVHYAGAKVILSGDATTDTERSLISNLWNAFGGNQNQQAGEVTLAFLNSHVLKLGHHGSRRTSNSVDWLSIIQPRFVFISSDRHGRLDDTNKSGHRLPQSLTLDLISKYSRLLWGKCAAHNIISAFDADEYDAYNSAPERPNDPVTYTDTGQHWLEQSVTAGIFTSLVKMDMTQADFSEADQGAQFQLSISHAGIVEISSTSEPRRLTGPISVRKLNEVNSK
ncbi:MAG: competence protein ComEC [Acidobacteriota bacterium]|jgi:beta-lactamase superfamily II metal-dependent hydrolase|nr:competence protein ComEC [Acidobacteriota bacterium]MDT5262322.1 competence protein ComEC [Acidobacteriota bacterium]